MFSKRLGSKLDKFHLLKHPFYQIYWNEGKLTREIIKDYAEQYYQHVKAFPRYISATHSICEDIEKVSPRLFSNYINNQDVNIIIGGPPCPTFSSIGQPKLQSLGNDVSKDKRNRLFINLMKRRLRGGVTQARQFILPQI